MILEDEHLRSLILLSNPNTTGNFEDFRDGTNSSTHPVVIKYPNAIQIVAYYDELEICNPLGSNVKKHKLGLVFFTIANMHPKYRSNFKAIFLSTVANITLIEEHGIDAILEPFVNDLKVLARTGITLPNQSRYYQWGFGCLFS